MRSDMTVFVKFLPGPPGDRKSISTLILSRHAGAKQSRITLETLETSRSRKHSNWNSSASTSTSPRVVRESEMNKYQAEME